MNKICTKCNIIKNVEFDFRQSRGRRQSWCKICVDTARKEYYQRFPEKLKERRQKHYQKYKLKLQQKARDYRLKNRERINEKNRERYYKDHEATKKRFRGPRYRYRAYKARDKQFGRIFSLTYEQFISFWQKACSYCGNAIDTICLDRIDSSLGYSIENVRPCCYMCNIMKWNFPLDVWITHLQRIMKYMRGVD